MEGGFVDEADIRGCPAAFCRDTTWGGTLPWTLAACSAIGAALMLTRVLFGTAGAMANSDHVVCALVITVSIVAAAEVARTLRIANAALGSWLLAAPWLHEGHDAAGRIASVAAGAALVALSLPRERRSAEHCAGWDRFII